MTKFNYPPTAKIEWIDDYHGTKVADPYRWLEESDSPETRAWIEAQNELTFGFLERIPGRERLRERLTELWNFPKMWAPVKKGGRYYLLHNSGLQNQPLLIVKNDLEEEGAVLLDPNGLSEDGTVALTGWSVSPDGRWLAYATSAAGSDWMTWRVRDTESGTDLEEVIQWSKFSGAEWGQDSRGFYYSRYDAPEPGVDYTGINTAQKLFYHRLGRPQTKDVLVYERPDQKEWGFNCKVSDDGRYLVIEVWQGTDVRNRLFYLDLEDGSTPVELVSDLEATYEFVGSDGPYFYLKTNLAADRGRVIAIDIRNPQKSEWETLITESEDTLESVTMVHDEFVALYLHHAHHVIRRFDREGAPLGDIPLPTPGSITASSSSPGLTGERQDSELFFNFGSFLYPLTVYRYEFKSGRREELFAPPLSFDTGAYITRQVFVPGRDGARIPLFLTHHRNLAADGQNPTLLYGYGGFNIPLVPAFAPSWLVWLEMGGVLAWANLRGGGEYGESWHAAGNLHHKQTVFDDFITCAEYLHREKISSPSRTAIMGRSNGGLLVGACLTQRPELFGAALPVVGVLDMLRFERFTIGWAWVSDYGSVEDPDQFETLVAYSPLHNIKEGERYPPTLVVTGDHDDRVVPGHSFKFTAALQAAQGGEAPILIRIQTRAGHGLGKPTTVLIEETADMWAFLVEVLGIELAGQPD